jgi:hypothetical protein
MFAGGILERKDRRSLLRDYRIPERRDEICKNFRRILRRWEAPTRDLLERQRRSRQLFHRARALSGAEDGQFLRSVCPEDEDSLDVAGPAGAGDE